MESKLNILVIERSLKIGSRFQDFLKDDIHVSSVRLADSLTNAFPFFETQIDMVLLGNHLDDSSMLQLSIACTNHNSCLIVLSEYPMETFKTKYQYLQADYLFNKSMDFEKIPYIIASRAKAQLNLN